MPEIIIYTDGAYNWEKKSGGWAALLLHDGKRSRISGHADHTSSNRMELTAAIEALKRVPEGSRVTLYSDSEYLIKSMNRQYRRKANLDLWQQLDALAPPRQVEWQWVKGHGGNPYNEEVNSLAEWEAGLLREAPRLPPAEAGGPLTHLDEAGRARMVDVGWKADTQREAVARGFVAMKPETLRLVKTGGLEKGDALAVARLAGIMGAKRTPDLVPLCHPIPLTHVSVELHTDEAKGGIQISATVRAEAKTGVEMEALTAVMCAGLALYDMCKSVDRGVRIESVRLVRKSGGKSGHIVLEE